MQIAMIGSMDVLLVIQVTCDIMIHMRDAMFDMLLNCLVAIGLC